MYFDCVAVHWINQQTLLPPCFFVQEVSSPHRKQCNGTLTKTRSGLSSMSFYGWSLPLDALVIDVLTGAENQV